VPDLGKEAAKRAFDRSLRRLGLDYLALYLIHQPFGDHHRSCRTLAHLNQEGRTPAIGVSSRSGRRPRSG